MIKLNRRGSILVYVLVTGVIVSMIASGLLRMVMMNYAAVDRTGLSAIRRKEAESLLNVAVSYWSTVNSVCSSIPMFACSGPAGTCSCTCSHPELGSIVVTGAPLLTCTITVTSRAY
ncbi:MAG: hypothetical protein AAB268_11360 [Elusimicrobiota bacterium]|mgnify:CR=1 FL=1